jgi:hypothetical protein
MTNFAPIYGASPDENSVTYISVAEDAESVELYDAVLEIDSDGAWSWRRIRGSNKRGVT